MYGNGFLSWDFTDQCEILHGSQATSQTGFLLFFGGGDSPKDGRIMGVNKIGVRFRSPNTASKSRIAQKLCFVVLHVNETLTSASNGLYNDVGPRALTPGALAPKFKK